MTSPNTEWPSTPIPEPVKTLLNKFYALADQKSSDVGLQLSEQVFTPTGQIIVNDKRRITGKEEIKKSGGQPWDGIQSRLHEVLKIYTCNDAADDLLVIGKVAWVFNNGKELDAGFCARVVVDGGDSEKPRLKLYQGWADLSEMLVALKDQKRSLVG